MKTESTMKMKLEILSIIFHIIKKNFKKILKSADLLLFSIILILINYTFKKKWRKSTYTRKILKIGFSIWTMSIIFQVSDRSLPSYTQKYNKAIECIKVWNL